MKNSLVENLIPPSGPPRTLALSQLVCRVGDGAYYVCAALFFTRIVGLSPVQMGLGLTIGWSMALVLSVPLGHLADRKGLRGTAIILFLCAAAALTSYLFITSFAQFVVAAAVYAVSQRGASAAEQAMITKLVPERQFVEVRAFVQSSYNAGLAIGAGLGGLVLVFDQREAYYTAFALNALVYVATVVIIRRLPKMPPAPSSKEATGGAVFRNRPYIVVTALNTLLLLHIPLVDIALPLWISEHTEAPLWLLSVMFILNTVCVVLFQVRVSRGVVDLKSAYRYVFYGASLLALGCLVFAMSAGSKTVWITGLVLLLAVAIQVAGEMMHAAGSWELSFGLAPNGKHGQYQAFFGNGITIAEMAGPLILTGLIVYWGVPGWILLAVLFVVAAGAMGPAVRWGQRSLPADPVEPVENLHT